MGNTFSEKHADHPAPAFIERGEPAEESITLRFNTTTLGERLIPVLLLGGEVCVGYALLVGLAASVSFAGMAEPLLPVWGLPLMMLSFYVSSRLFQRCSPTGVARKVIEPITWLPLALCLALVFVWLNNYAQTIPLVSPDWLLALIHDFIPVTPPPDAPPGAWADIHVDVLPAIQTMGLALIAGVAGWRGHRLTTKYVISDDIQGLFKWGSVCIVLVIGVFLLRFYAGATHLSQQIPALLAAIFFICVLTARSLENASYMRRFHRVTLWGSAASQERIIWFSMLLLGLVAILLAIFLGTATTGKLTPMQQPRTNSVPGHATPIRFPPGQVTPFPYWLFILVLLAIAGIVAFLLWKRAQQLQNFKLARTKKAREENSDELHETVFNWSLFLAQLWSILAYLNPFRKRKRSSVEKAFDDLRLVEPGVRSIREVYRALLKKAASRGQARERDETPYEFRGHLDRQEELAGPELEAITEAYVLVRYSGTQPGKEEVDRVKQVWETLRQRWG